MTTYYVKVGDVGSVTPQTFLEDSKGDPASLVGASVRFIMRAPGDSVPTVAADADIVDELTAEVQYTWVVGDLDVAGFYRAEWEVTYASGAVESFPADGYIAVVVRADLDT